MVSLFPHTELRDIPRERRAPAPPGARLRHVIDQEPLFETAPSRHAMAEAAPSLVPRTVFAGIGLVSGSRLTRALPFDVLGLVLGAEHARRALSAERTLVLVADAHARDDGAPPALLEQRAREYTERLRAIAARCGFRHMRVVRASEWEQDPEYRATLRHVQRALPASTDAYVVRETADITHVDRLYGGVLKVGWALRAARAGAARDERVFDETFRRFVGGDACFVYAKAGRALDDRRQKVSPYIAANPARRICLAPEEDVQTKLCDAQRQVSRATYRGVCNHLRAVTRSYGKLVRPLSGDVAARTQAVIDELVGPRAEPLHAQQVGPDVPGGLGERSEP